LLVKILVIPSPSRAAQTLPSTLIAFHVAEVVLKVVEVVVEEVEAVEVGIVC
jgi:hypothetical protein